MEFYDLRFNAAGDRQIKNFQMKKHSFNIIQLLMIIGIILMINVISAFFHIAVDFTGDKR
ncbi:MAG TPA: hypothetical protein DCX89_06540 [Saprospirales bacterium]|nr:hypothetical protein [Saprospirales bacterium]